MENPVTVSFYTLGCKLNFAETSSIVRSLEKEGYQIVAEGMPSNFHILNTCSVTDQADKKCRAHIKRVLKYSPDSKIVVIGCYAQLKPEEISAMPHVRLVLGAQEKFRLGAYLRELSKQDKLPPRTEYQTIGEVSEFHAAWSLSERTRSFLKVQDGCDYSCSFCTIPLARGKSRNAYITQVIDNAREIAGQGVAEIVLTGVNLGDFGKSSGENFLELIQALDKVEGIKRFRISSIEPNLLVPEIISFVAASDKFTPHFHLPLQSGNDRILGLMRRRYRTRLYASRIEQIKKIMPDCAIGADVIVGFPGETRDDFLQTYTFLNNLDISYLHVFSYSERANTLALTMPGKVSAAEKAERSKMLHILSEKKKHAFYQKYIGMEMEVLLETDNKSGKMHGFTSNYIKVAVPYHAERTKQLVRVQLQGIDEHGDIEGLVLNEMSMRSSFSQSQMNMANSIRPLKDKLIC